MPCRIRPREGARRPALAGALAFAVGIWAAHTHAIPAWSAALAVVALVCLLLVRVNAAGLTAVVVFAGLGTLRYQVSQIPHSSFDLRWHRDSGGQIVFYGRTAGETEVKSRGSYLILEADSVAYADSVCVRRGRVLARFKFDPGIPPDSRVVLRGRLRAPPPDRRRDDFSWSEYLLRRELCTLFEPAAGTPVLSVEPSGAGFSRRIIAPLRARLKGYLVRYLDGQEAALLPGLLLGEKEALSAETIAAFQRTGTLHLLAVSGSNVGVVAAVIWGVLLFLRLGRAWRLLFAAVAVLLYCFLAHVEDSVVRATTAALLVIVGSALRRRTDALNLWACTLLLVLAWNPLTLLGPGFQLSFAATLGILLLAPLAPGTWEWSWRALGRVLRASITVSLAAQAATLPIIADAFHEVPLVTPVANLLAVPLAGLATLAGVMMLLAAPFGDVWLVVLSGASWLFLRGLLLVASAFQALGTPVGLPSPGTLEVAWYCALLLGAWSFASYPRSRRRILLGAIFGLTLVVGWLHVQVWWGL